MSEETIGVIIAGLVLAVFIWYTRFRDKQQTPIGSTPPVASTLAAAVNPDQFEMGPSYFIANQPYYFAPPVGNMMPQAVASRTLATNEDNVGAGCGCG